MANATREPATTLIQPISTPNFSQNPAFKPGSASPRLSSSNPQLASLANAGLSAATKTISSKGAMPPNFHPPPLTGAAAMAENARHAKEMEERKGPKTSPNPARTAFMGLTSQGMSRPEDAPQSTLISKPKLVPTIVTEPMDMDGPQVSPTIMSSPVEMTVTNPLTSSPSAAKSRKRPASPRTEERQIKAMTYPPGPTADEESPSSQHNPSFPGPSSTNTPSKSPSYSSSKKHKCPHCSTEFTRHHNLKSHLLTHSQEKPYGCQQCSSRFRRLHDLKRHLKLHTGERPHICVKCGRKFARGDALARHNKGPGGCAGRRGSGGDGDEYGEGGSELDPSMEGVSYEGEEGHEAGDDEEQYADEHRRRSEPDRSRNDSLPSGVGSTSGGSYHQHSSTYPGIAPISNISRGGLYPPPPASNQSTTTSPRTLSRHPSPKAPGGSTFSAVQYNAPSLYAQNLITESPKPMSPGQVDTRRHSPSISSKLQQTRLGHSIGGGSSLNSLPPPMTQSAQLPSLTSMTDPRFAQQLSGPSTTQALPTFATQQASGAMPASGSVSSHQQSSGGNMREAIGGSLSGGYSQQDASMWEYVRSMERRLEEFAARMKEQETHYEAEISRLRDEVTVLRGQKPQPVLQRQPQQPQQQ